MKWPKYILILLLFSACSKETLQLEVVELQSGTTEDIHDIKFVDDNLAFYCGGDLWKTGVIGRSTDGGQNWEVVLETDNILFSLAFKNANEGIAVGFSGRVWRTIDGGETWSLTENAPSYPNLSDAVFVSDNKVLLSAGFNYYTGGFATYFFDGQNFQDSLINQDMQALYFFDDQRGLVAGYGALFNTSSGGQAWQANSVKGDYFKDVDFNEDGEGLLIGYQGRIFHSVDKGISWEKSAKKKSFFSTKGNLESVVVSGDKAFITGQNHALFYTDNFLEDNWIEVETPFSDDYNSIYLLGSSSGMIAGGNGRLFSFTF